MCTLVAAECAGRGVARALAVVRARGARVARTLPAALTADSAHSTLPAARTHCALLLLRTLNHS